MNIIRIKTSALLLAVFAVFATAQAGTIHVAPGGTGALPFLTIAAEAATYSVDPVNGVDEPDSPVYKTLTFALAQHGGDANYELAAGVYSAASGEVFPIRLENLSGVGITGVGGQAVFDAERKSVV